MKVRITFNETDLKEYDFSKDEIIIGRSSDCDIVIDNENISRKHLKVVTTEGKIFISDISSSNWVSYNDEKIEKGKDTEYFDFMSLKLPDMILVVIEKNQIRPEVSVPPDSTEISSIEITKNKLLENKKSKPERSRRKDLSVLGALILVVGGVFLGFTNGIFSDFLAEKKEPLQNIDDTSKQVMSKNVREEIIEEKNTIQVNEMVKLKKQIRQEVKKVRKCRDKISKKYCDILFSRGRGNTEGVYLGKNNDLFVVFDEANIKLNFDLYKGLEFEFIYKLVFLEKFLIKSALDQLKSDKVEKVHIRVKSKSSPYDDKFLYIIDNISKIEIGIMRHDILTEEYKEFGNFNPFINQYGKYIYGEELQN